MFLQETHSTFNDENNWKNDFNGPVLYSHSTSHSCKIYTLVNIYNANTEVEQVQGLSEPGELMKNINFSEENRKVFAGYLNVFFNSKLQTKGGKPSLKQKYVAKLLELK